ncbi:MAG: class I SAM-dependent methyltransferase, partial [Pseudothermotoga sp.]
MKLRELYTILKDVLKEASESPGSEALSVLTKVTSQTRERLLMNFEEEVPEEVCQLAISLAKKRAGGYPLQYITERCYFYGLELHVREGVFVPRIETEMLVELALKLIEEKGFKMVADVGTGTGCIAIAIALESECEVLATDISERALEVARCNVERYRARVRLLKGA